MRPMLTTADIVECLKITRPTLRRWIELQLFPKPLKFGHLCRWPEETIEKWLANGGPVTIRKINAAQRLALESEACGTTARFAVEGILAEDPQPADGEVLGDAEDIMAEADIEAAAN